MVLCWQKTKERKRNVLVSTQGKKQEMLPGTRNSAL